MIRKLVLLIVIAFTGALANAQSSVDAAGPSAAAGRRRELFSGPYLRSLGYRSHTYDIAPDGERFLMLRESENNTQRNEIIVALNWFEELTERVPIP